jgi:hypothetical protein
MSGRLAAACIGGAAAPQLEKKRAVSGMPNPQRWQ